jgi:hypothetical protein
MKTTVQEKSSSVRKCRAPTVQNPFMNTPIVELGSSLQPCYDQIDKVDEFANVGTVRDMDDILRDSTENRAFFTMPNGGGPPDFSKFSRVLGRDVMEPEEDCQW